MSWLDRQARAFILTGPDAWKDRRLVTALWTRVSTGQLAFNLNSRRFDRGLLSLARSHSAHGKKTFSIATECYRRTSNISPAFGKRIEY